MAIITASYENKSKLDTTSKADMPTVSFSSAASSFSIYYPQANSGVTCNKNNCSKQYTLSNRTFNYNWYVNGTYNSSTNGLTGSALMYHTLDSITYTVEYVYSIPLYEASGTAIGSDSATIPFGNSNFPSIQTVLATIKSSDYMNFLTWKSLTLTLNWSTYQSYVNSDMWYTNVTLPTPVVANYHSKNNTWYTDSNYTTSFGTYGTTIKDAGYRFNGSITLNRYTQYDGDQHNIVYHANGGTGNMELQTVTYGSGGVGIKANEFDAPANKEFIGWNSLSDGTGQNYTVNQTISNLTGQLDLYAQWNYIDCTVNFNHNNGTGNITTGSVKYSSTLNSIWPTDPTYINNRFEGWFDSGGIQVTRNTIVTSTPYNLTAHWTPLTYTLVLYDNDSPSSTYQTITATVTQYPSSSITWPTKAGYKFLGYFDENNVQWIDQNKQQANNKFTNKTNLDTLVLYAHWQYIPIYIYSNNSWIPVKEAYVYKNNTWVKAQDSYKFYIYTNNEWKAHKE